MIAPRRVVWALLASLACAPAAEEPDREAAAPDEEITPAAYEIDPCGVLTPEDILEVTGSEAGTPQRVDPVEGGASYCDWPPAADTFQTLLTVMAIPAPAMSFEEYVEQSRAVLGEEFSWANYERVDGVGESAVWANHSTLQTWDKDRMVQIQSGVGGPALHREQSAELARRALDRL